MGLPPGRVLASSGGRLDAVSPQDVADCLIGHVMTQVGERTNDAIVPPAGVLASHFHNQCFDFGPDSRAAWIAALFRTVEFAGDQPSVPCQDRVWLGNLGYLSQRFASETLTDLRQRGPLGVRQAHPRRQMRPQDSVFRSQVLVLEEQFLVDQAGHVGQQA